MSVIEPCCVSAEDRPVCYRLSLFLCQLPCPGCAFCLRGAFSAVVILIIACCQLIVLIPPVVPSGRGDVASEVTVHEEGVGVWSPWASEVAFVDSLTAIALGRLAAFKASYRAVVEDISVSDILRC